MTHFLSLTCLSYLRSWYLTCDAVLAGAARDEELPPTIDENGRVVVDRATGTITTPLPLHPLLTNTQTQTSSRPRLM